MRQKQAATAEVVVVGEVCCDVEGDVRRSDEHLELTQKSNSQVFVSLVRFVEVVLNKGAGADGSPQTVIPWKISGTPTQISSPSSWMFGGEMPAMKILPPMFTIFMLPIEGFRKAFSSSTHPCRTPMLVFLPM